MNSRCDLGPGDFEAPELFDHERYAEHMMSPGQRYDPTDGDVIAEAIGELTEGQFQSAGVLLYLGKEHEFCLLVRAETEAYCRRMAYAEAAAASKRA
jgi:hypothetical protein